MRPIVSAEEMQRCDRAAIRSYGIPSLLLMENAGSGVAKWIQDRLGPIEGKAVAIVCGKGNNGGDGLVAARHLVNVGARVTVFLVKGRQTGDAAANARILSKVRAAIPGRLRIEQPTSSLLSSSRPDIVVDALFGTGFSGPVRREYAHLIDWINKQMVPRIAVDIPSGVNGTSGEVLTSAVKATATLTLAAIKRGLMCNQGRDHAGEIAVIDIGIPASVFESLKPNTVLADSKAVRAMLPVRPSTVHKYSSGKVYILAGSRGYTGAAALAASSALRSGAGAVVLGTPDAVYRILARKLTEVIVEPLPSTPDGTLAESGLTAINRRMEWADTVAIGPGLSRQKETASLVHTLLKNARGRVLLDADALNITADLGSGFLRTSKATIVLTPHTGEFSRLTGLHADDIEANRIDKARNGSQRFRCVLVLKGAPTVIAAPEGQVVVNTTGNPGMATVGSGDVLSGMIAGFWAQGMGAFEASVAGVYLHGKSGDLAAAVLGQRSLLAGDLQDYLPRAFQHLRGGH